MKFVITFGIRKSGCLEIPICANWDSLATLLQKQIQEKLLFLFPCNKLSSLSRTVMWINKY